MPPNVLTSTRGSTLTVTLTGPLDRRLASSLFSRFLAAQSGYDDLVLDLTHVEEVHDTGLSALRLLRKRAREAGKQLTIVDCSRHDCGAQAHASIERGAVAAPAASPYPWVLLSHGHGAGLQRAASRIAAPLLPAPRVRWSDHGATSQRAI